MKKILLSAGYLILALATPSMSDVICSSDIGYNWQKTGDENDRIVGFDHVEQQAADEEQAKAKLAIRVEDIKAKASHACRREHENLAGCISSKLQALAGPLNAASFGARKSMEDAVVSDCAGQQGKCGEITAGEVKCREHHTKPTVAPTAEEKGKGKKDKKG